MQQKYYEKMTMFEKSTLIVIFSWSVLFTGSGKGWVPSNFFLAPIKSTNSSIKLTSQWQISRTSWQKSPADNTLIFIGSKNTPQASFHFSSSPYRWSDLIKQNSVLFKEYELLGLPIQQLKWGPNTVKIYLKDKKSNTLYFQYLMAHPNTQEILSFTCNTQWETQCEQLAQDLEPI